MILAQHSNLIQIRSMFRNQCTGCIPMQERQSADCFAAPITNCTNKYGEAFVLSKQTVQIIIPTVVLIARKNIVAQCDVERIFFGRKFGEFHQILYYCLQSSFSRHMGPGLIMIPTVQRNLIAGNTRLVELTEQLFIQQITIGGHIGSILEAALFL